MNNLAISLAQQNAPPSFSPSEPPASAAALLADAKAWAQKSLALASSMKPPERTAECDEGCAVATINLGEFAMMEGNLDEAERRYKEGRELSKAVGYQDGTKRADELLQEFRKKR